MTIDDQALNRAWDRFVQKIAAGTTFTSTYGRPLALGPGEEPLAGRLMITPGRLGQVDLTWRPAIPRRSELDLLVEIRERSDPLDEPFRAAVDRLIAHISSVGRRYEAAFDEPLPPRPDTGQLPEALRERLLIGRQALHYQGIMPRGLWAMVAGPAGLDRVDQDAVRRLYRRTVERGLNHGGLKISTRRGAAPPAEQRPIDIE